MIEVDGLGRRFGARDAVLDLTFRVGAGEVVGFLGQNGAGKTTTLRVLAGLLRPDRGAARVAGRDVVADGAAAREVVGFLPERAPVYPELTAHAHLRLLAALRGRGEAAVAAVAERLALEPVLARRLGALSKGWRQRVALAGAVLHRPPVVLLDEPMSGLDPGQRREVRELLRELAADGAAVLVSSHALSEVEEGCDRVLLIHGGQLRADVGLDALGGGLLRVRVERPEGFVAVVSALPGVRAVAAGSGGGFELQVEGEVRAAVAAAAVPFGLLELSTPRRLEALWLRVVGEA